MSSIGVKPSKIVIDRKSPFARGLVWCATPGIDSPKDLIWKGAATLLTSGSYVRGAKFGNAADSSSTSNGGISYPWSEKLTEIGATPKFSIVVIERLDSLTNFSHLFSIPYGATWSSPYAALHWFRNNTTNNMCLSWCVGDNNFDACVSSGTDFPTDGLWHVLGVSCTATDSSSGRSTRFFKDGVLSGTGTTASGGTITWGGKKPIVLLNHSLSDNGEGIDGQVAFAAIWKRQLTDKEMSEIAANPWQLFKKSVLQIGKAPTPPATSIKDLIQSGIIPFAR